MNSDFPQRLHELVELAKKTRREGIHGVDPEEWTKHNLIEPLLQALGFDRDDIRKEFHILGAQCDYLLERRRPLLFVEAKSITDKAKNIFEKYRDQVLGYLRNYRISPEQGRVEKPVTWLLLTNFAQLHLIRANEDKPTFSFRLDQLEDKAAEIWELLSEERMEGGRIEELYDQEQKADLDQRFLADLKQWRLILANGFGIRNQTASLADLTSASQQLLDRFLFCRMLETNGLIEYNKLARSFVSYDEFSGTWSRKTFAGDLRERLFLEIQAKFNTELFVQPQLCDTLEIDNTFLAAIIGHTSLPTEVALTCGLEQSLAGILSFRHLYSYDFSRMSHDIMGAVYERFLAHKLQQKSGRILIEETDELRKKEGIYYTPQYIVDYIVGHTLGEKTEPIVTAAIDWVAERNFSAAHAKIRELAEIKVVDPSMGSGSFLLRAFDHLLDCYSRYNQACRDLKQTGRIRETPGELFGADEQVAEEIFNPAFYIVAENIFGVDLDPQAVELARLNLWMRLMIAERDIMRERLRVSQANGHPLSLLPSLARNLRRGNSLIPDPAVAGDAAFAWQEQFAEIMARGGFDVVVGNPPYERIQTMTEYAPGSLEYLRTRYKTAEAGNFDIYVCFVEKGLGLLNNSGLFGYILPNKFFQSEYGKALRELISENRHLREIVSFGDQQVFNHATTYTCLLLLGKTPNEEFVFRLPPVLSEWRVLPETGGTIFPSAYLSAEEWNFVVGPSASIQKKLIEDCERLDLITQIFVGIQTSADDVFIMNLVERKTSTLKLHSKSLDEVVELERALLHPLASGTDVSAYGPLPDRQYLLFPYLVVDENAVLLSWDRLSDLYPMTAAYLEKNRTRLEGREAGKFADDRWYRLGRSQNLGIQSRVKLCVPRLVSPLIATADFTGSHYLDNVDVGGVMLKETANDFDLRYILALLNSTLLRWYFQFLSPPFRGGYRSANKQFLGQLPIKRLRVNSSKLRSTLTSQVDKLLGARASHAQLLPTLLRTIRHEHRTPCSLGHYLQPDYAEAIVHDILIDDVMRKGFIHGIALEADNGSLILSAQVSETSKEKPEMLPLLRMRVTHAPLRQFLYACWQQFLSDNARRKRWTTGNKPEEIYRRIINAEEPFVYFHSAAADNLRATTSLMEAVGHEAGVTDLAALELEIKETDEEIDKLVYDLYELSPQEIKLVEAETD